MDPRSLRSSGPTSGTLLGADLFPGMSLVGSDGTTFFPLAHSGSGLIGDELSTTITPDGSVLGVGCIGIDVTAAHPFGGSSVTMDLFNFNDSGQVPLSPYGDTNADGRVDGLDLSALGRAFGADYCDGLVFNNDVDFNDDDLINGDDLAILASFFGRQP